MSRQNNKGFTIVQLIITLSVIVILAVGAIQAYNPTKRIGQTNDARRSQDIESLAKALETYQIDNDQLPADFTGLNIYDTHKVVLCSSAAELTCDGQSRDCLVVDDVDFLGEYIPSLPIDPTKIATTDTGYYVTRDEDRLAFGACDTYDSDGIEYIAKVALADYAAECGDGEVEGNEVCDDGNTTTETCGDGQITVGGCSANCMTNLGLTEVCDDLGNNTTETCGDSVIQYGTYCSQGCGTVLNLFENCEYFVWTDDCLMPKVGWVTEADFGGLAWCTATCRLNTSYCLP